MFAVVFNDEILGLIPEKESFVLGNQQHPANWLELASTAAKEARGIYPVVYGPKPVSRYAIISEVSPVWDSANKVVRINYTTQSVNIDAIKSHEITNVTNHANNILQITNKMILDAHDSGTTLSQAWINYRSAVLLEKANLITSISNAKGENDIIHILASASWPTKPKK